MQPVQIRHPIIQSLVYSHTWLALGAAAQVWWTLLLIGDRNNAYLLIASIFFGTIAAYNFMRLMRAKGALATSVPLFIWTDRNRSLLWIVVLVSALGAAIAILPLIPRAMGLLWWVVPLCLLYVLPFGYPEYYCGLRAIPMIKAPLVGLVWTIVTVALPAKVTGSAIGDPAMILLIFQRALLIMALIIAFDIRDAASDPPRLRTLPQLFGDRGARAIAIGMILIAALVSVSFSLPDPDHRCVHLLPLIGMFISVILVHGADRSKPESFFSFMLDGVLILIPLLAWIGSLIS